MNGTLVQSITSLAFAAAVAWPVSAAELPVLVPKPSKLAVEEGQYVLGAQTSVHISPATTETREVANFLVELVAPATGIKLVIDTAEAGNQGGIVLRLDPARTDLGTEGYALKCTKDGIAITASKAAGLFYGVQTMRQLLPAEIESRQPVAGLVWSVPCVSIEDQPRFRWRGYLIDPARNFRTKEELIRYIDLLALHKLNVLQIHLTDDQGWRVEIKRYPKLVEVGSRLPDFTGRRGEGWFYSRADIREIVAHAARRHVTVVPEIEMPGHSGAALASYPDLACNRKAPSGWSCPLCVSDPATLEFATGVLDEVASLFPSPFIHVGADEVPPGSWRDCTKCKPQMEQLANVPLPPDVPRFRVKVTSNQGVPFNENVGRMQGEFIRKIDAHLTAKGRRMVGWDEILEGGLKDGSPAVVMAWRGPSAVTSATNSKRDVVVTLHPDYYLDNDTPLQQTYAYEPIPADLPQENRTHVIGVQGNMWGETTSSLQKVDARTFPRLCAIAETAWTPPEEKNFADFAARIKVLRKRLVSLNVACGAF